MKRTLPALLYQNATTLLSALASQRISSLELLEQAISRIEQLDDRINAVPVRDFDRARMAAKAADAAIARGERRLLLGLPMTVKESFNVAGLPTSWGNPHYKNWQPDASALAVERLESAGAIILGKTNVPLMLKDWQTYNTIYGTTNNPWNLDLTPGGSSGGSAAALAAGFTSLELGSDAAGSLRVPAHYCGVFAHRPSLHLIPMRGTAPPDTPSLPGHPHDFVAIGPMARSAQDLALALEILAGPDPQWDGKAYRLSLPKPRHTQLRDFRVLMLDTHPRCPISDRVKTSMAQLADQLTRLGVSVSRTAPNIPDLEDIIKNYARLFAAFVGQGMTLEVYKKTQEFVNTLETDDDSLRAHLSRGFVLNHRDWGIATRTRTQLREQWRALYQTFDVVLYPVMPTPALPHDHTPFVERHIDIDGQPVPYLAQHAWVSIVSLFGLPTTVAPINPINSASNATKINATKAVSTKTALPIGIQIIGDYLDDYTTIKFAELLEQEFGGFTAPPL